MGRSLPCGAILIPVLGPRCCALLSLVVVSGGYSLVAVRGIPWWLGGKESASAGGMFPSLIREDAPEQRSL